MKWMSLAFFVWALSSSPAEARCVWGNQIEAVYATMTYVSINGRKFPVKGDMARARFIAHLRSCGVDEIVISTFEDWREMRRWTNISGGSGFCLCLPWFAAPVTAVLAGSRQTELVSMLRAS